MRLPRLVCALVLLLGVWVVAPVAQVTDLVSFWSLEEASGTRDDAHSTNDLADTNSVGVAAGKVDNAADFEEGSAQYLSIADNAALSMGDIDFTIVAWVNAESFPGGDRSIVAKGDGTDGEYYLQYRTTSTRFRFVAHGGTGFGTTNAVTANNLGAPSPATWYFIVAWHDATANEVGIQVNDGTADTAAATGGAIDDGGAFHLGAYPAFGQHWDGLIDQVGVYKKVLSAGEKTALYNSNNGLSYAAMGGGAATTPKLLLLGVGGHQ